MISQALTAIADWVGRSGREKDAGRRAAWAAILMPFDDLRGAMAYLEDKGAEAAGKPPTSICALVVARFFALVGCTCSEHQKAYRPRAGQAVIDVERVARRHGAWRTSAEDLAAYPTPGDILCMRIENPHVSIVVDSRAEDGAILSIDGGAIDNTWTERRARMLVAPPGQPAYLVDLDDGVAQNVGRRSVIYARVGTAAIVASLDRCS